MHDSKIKILKILHYKQKFSIYLFYLFIIAEQKLWDACFNAVHIMAFQEVYQQWLCLYGKRLELSAAQEGRLCGSMAWAS